MRKNLLWRAYATCCLGLGLRADVYHMYAKTAYQMHANKFNIICTRKLRIKCMPTNLISYARENGVSYAWHHISYMHTKTAYHMHAKYVHSIHTPKSVFSYQYHEFWFLFCVLFIRTFMRQGSTNPLCMLIWLLCQVVSHQRCVTQWQRSPDTDDTG